MAKDNVIRLSKEDAPEIVSALCDSFYNYPVMRFVLIDDKDYDNRLHTLINFFVMARMLRNETAFGIKEDSGLIAVATTSNPSISMKIPDLIALRNKTWQILGNEAKERYEKFGKVWAKLEIDKPNIHLNMLGVKQNAKKTGAGRLLLERVQQFSLNDPHSQGVTLTTEDPDNVAYYEYMGYKITGHGKVENDIQTWNFFRAD